MHRIAILVVLAGCMQSDDGAGAPWQFTFPPDHEASGGRPNCVSVMASAPTSFTVTATALGKSTSTRVTFVQ